MTFNFVTSDFDPGTLLHRVAEKSFSAFTDSTCLPQSAKLILSVFILSNVLLLMLLPLEILICSLKGDPMAAIQESGKWGGKKWLEGCRRTSITYFLGKPRWRKGKPMEEGGQDTLGSLPPVLTGFLSASLPRAVSVPLVIEAVWGEGLICAWFVTCFVEYLHLAAQWDWQKNNTFDMLFYLSTFCHDILWCKFLILLQLSAALAVTAQGQQWG